MDKNIYLNFSKKFLILISFFLFFCFYNLRDFKISYAGEAVEVKNISELRAELKKSTPYIKINDSEISTLEIKEPLEIYSNLKLEFVGNSNLILTKQSTDNTRHFNVNTTNDAITIETKNIELVGNADLDKEGGGILVKGEKALILKDVIVSNCLAYDGGAVYSLSSIDIDGNTKFLGNKATNNGGAVYSNTQINIKSGYIHDNSAKNGGGVYSNSSFNMTGGEVYKNISTENGGGIFSRGNSNISSKLSIYENESKKEGGGLYSGASVRIGTHNILSDTVIRDNKAGTYGGGVKASTLSLYCGNINNNTALKSGGGIFTVGSVATYLGNINENKATSYGGGIYSAESGVSMYGGTISENEAEYGGGIYSDSEAYEIKIENGNITGNHALDSGGGIYGWGNIKIHVDKYGGSIQIQKNTAKKFGAGIYNHDPTKITLDGEQSKIYFDQNKCDTSSYVKNPNEESHNGHYLKYVSYKNKENEQLFNNWDINYLDDLDNTGYAVVQWIKNVDDIDTVVYEEEIHGDAFEVIEFSENNYDVGQYWVLNEDISTDFSNLVFEAGETKHIYLRYNYFGSKATVLWVKREKNNKLEVAHRLATSGLHGETINVSDYKIQESGWILNESDSTQDNELIFDKDNPKTIRYIYDNHKAYAKVSWILESTVTDTEKMVHVEYLEGIHQVSETINHSDNYDIESSLHDIDTTLISDVSQTISFDKDNDQEIEFRYTTDDVLPSTITITIQRYEWDIIEQRYNMYLTQTLYGQDGEHILYPEYNKDIEWVIDEEKTSVFPEKYPSSDTTIEVYYKLRPSKAIINYYTVDSDLTETLFHSEEIAGVYGGEIETPDENMPQPPQWIFDKERSSEDSELFFSSLDLNQPVTINYYFNLARAYASSRWMGKNSKGDLKLLSSVFFDGYYGDVVKISESDYLLEYGWGFEEMQLNDQILNEKDVTLTLEKTSVKDRDKIIFYYKPIISKAVVNWVKVDGANENKIVHQKNLEGEYNSKIDVKSNDYIVSNDYEFDSAASTNKNEMYFNSMIGSTKEINFYFNKKFDGGGSGEVEIPSETTAPNPPIITESPITPTPSITPTPTNKPIITESQITKKPIEFQKPISPTSLPKTSEPFDKIEYEKKDYTIEDEEYGMSSADNNKIKENPKTGESIELYKIWTYFKILLFLILVLYLLKKQVKIK